MAVSPNDCIGNEPNVAGNRAIEASMTAGMTTTAIVRAGSALLISLLATNLPAQDTPRLEWGFDAEKGLVSATYGGDVIIKDGEVRVLGVRLQERGVDNANGEWTYAETHLKSPAGDRAIDVEKKTVCLRYEWGEVATRYKPEKDRLTVEVSIHNRSEQHICGFWLDVMRLSLPAKRETDMRIGRRQRAMDSRIIQASSFGNSNLVVLAYETLETPLALWIDKPKGEGAAHPLLLSGGIPLPEPGECYVHSGGRPAIPPGQTLTVRFSLRFAPAATPIAEQIQDIAQAMRDIHGTGPNWKDRRPIGMLILSSVGHRSATNPRGWFHDRNIDVTTEDGKTAFHARALAYADRAVKILTNMNAQGMIVWDVEGSENPHPVTYIGDPRLAGRLAPEMDAVANEFFQKFRDAGLRAGICIRPSRVYFNKEKGKWAHNPCNAWPKPTEYEDVKPKEVPRWRFYPIARRLSDKIEYAKQRWGTTLIYIDTNIVGQWVGEKPNLEMVKLPLSGQMYRDVMTAHPDVLLIPEHWRKQESTWAYCAPYMELDLGGTGTPEHMRRIFPNAFCIVNVVDGPFDRERSTLLTSVKNGDILLFRGWFNAKTNGKIKNLYDEATGKQKQTGGTEEDKIDHFLDDIIR